MIKRNIFKCENEEMLKQVQNDGKNDCHPEPHHRHPESYCSHPEFISGSQENEEMLKQVQNDDNPIGQILNPVQYDGYSAGQASTPVQNDEWRRMEQMPHQSQNSEWCRTSPSLGRSMIEMLGVLAIIGILSIVGLAGFRMAMTYHKANETIHDVMLRATNVPMKWDNYGDKNIWSNKVFNFDDFGVNFAQSNSIGYPVEVKGDDASSSYLYYVTVSEVPKRVCERILGLEPNAVDLIKVGLEIEQRTGAHSVKTACEETGPMRFYFDEDWNDSEKPTPPIPCIGADCDENGNCIGDDCCRGPDCDENGNCPPNSDCCTGVGCTPPEPGDVCTDDSQCGTLCCRNGSCTTDCGSGKACTSDSECTGSGECCRNDACTTDCGSGKACTSDSECTGSGECCRNDACTTDCTENPCDGLTGNALICCQNGLTCGDCEVPNYDTCSCDPDPDPCCGKPEKPICSDFCQYPQADANGCPTGACVDASVAKCTDDCCMDTSNAGRCCPLTENCECTPTDQCSDCAPEDLVKFVESTGETIIDTAGNAVITDEAIWCCKSKPESCPTTCSDPHYCEGQIQGACGKCPDGCSNPQTNGLWKNCCPPDKPNRDKDGNCSKCQENQTTCGDNCCNENQTCNNGLCEDKTLCPEGQISCPEITPGAGSWCCVASNSCGSTQGQCCEGGICCEGSAYSLQIYKEKCNNFVCGQVCFSSSPKYEQVQGCCPIGSKPLIAHNTKWAKNTSCRAESVTNQSVLCCANGLEEVSYYDNVDDPTFVTRKVEVCAN